MQIEWIKRAVRLCLNQEKYGEIEKEYENLEKQYNMFSEEEKNKIREIMKSQFEVNDFIYIFSHFIFYMKNESFREDLLDMIQKVDVDPYIGSMLELQITRIDGYYRKKREFHRKNVEKFIDILHISYPYIPIEKRNKKRIVMITEQILSLAHAPTRIVMNYAYVLQEILGYEILLFLCPCDGKLPEDLWIYTEALTMNSLEQFKNAPLKIGYKNTEFFGYQINMGENSLKEYSMMFSLIYAFNPIFVLNVGIFHPIADAAGKFTTTVAMGMSVSCPVSEAEILLRADKREELIEKEYEELLEKNQKQIFVKERFPASVGLKESEKSYTRQEFGLPEDKFLIAIVGNRLDNELEEVFFEVMLRILQKEPDAVFVMIGEVQKVKERLDRKEFKNNVYYLGYQTDLQGVYSMFDLYLNPVRAGGGFSSAMALKKGVPVVTLPNCDVAYNVGEEFIVQNTECMVDQVCHYISDQEFYKKKKDCARKSMDENTEERMIECVKNVISKIVETMEEQGN
ncbi:MAG: glycosyltransferase family 4 protein [Lachnospiraceae bacterium]|nr:glycosyltransferase family 4 protein [Lachnospiraceae bacterium]